MLVALTLEKRSAEAVSGKKLGRALWKVTELLKNDFGNGNKVKLRPLRLEKVISRRFVPSIDGMRLNTD